MDAHFSQREDGQVDIDLGPEWVLVTEALNDCVSSLPPRGAEEAAPSPYWVDVTLDALDSAVASESSRPFIWGNSTLMRLKGGRVEARDEYDDEDIDGQFLDVETLRSLLVRWRRHIVRSAAVGNRCSSRDLSTQSDARPPGVTPCPPPQSAGPPTRSAPRTPPSRTL